MKLSNSASDTEEGCSRLFRFVHELCPMCYFKIESVFFLLLFIMKSLFSPISDLFLEDRLSVRIPNLFYI